MVSEDCICENAAPAPDGTIIRGKEAVAQFWQGLFRGSPQAGLTIEETLSAGLRCVVRWRCDRVEADGKAGRLRGVDLYRVRDGRICEILSYVKG